MTEFERQVFEPGEPFIYRKAPGVYELGIVKRDRGDGTYACYYSTGDTAAVTPVFLMRKLVNAHWAPFRWSHIWGRHSIEVGELIDRLEGSQEVFITDGDGGMFCRAVGVPEAFMGMKVIGITATEGCIDIEVCDD